MASVSDFLSEDSGAFSLSVNGFMPRVAVVPFGYDKGERMEILVWEGDAVQEGQTIAQGRFGSVQASIPGTVRKISAVQLPDGKLGKAVKIALGGSFSYTGKRPWKIDWSVYDASMLQLFFAERGVVSTFGRCTSLCAQIKQLHPQSARILVVRLFDDDPSRVTETFVAAHHAAEVAEGAAIIAKAMRANGVVFVRSADGKDAAAHRRDDAMFDVPAYDIACTTARYPAGTRHELVVAVRKQLPEQPFSGIGNRDLFIDVQTALAAYRAVALSTPLLETYVHVTGDCLNAGAIMNVKIGTTLGELAAQCGGFKRPVAGIVINGIVTGFSVSSLDVPVTAMVKSVAFLPPRRAKRQHDEPCVRCGGCRNVCPVALYPDMFYRAFMHGSDATDLEKRYAATSVLCTGCALCNAVCPSRLPLSQIAALIKDTHDET